MKDWGASISGLIDMSLVFGVVLALAIAELVSLRRAKRRDARHEQERNAGSDKL